MDWIFVNAYQRDNRSNRSIYSRELSSHAHALNLLGRHDKALQRAKQALALDPRNVDANEQQKMAESGPLRLQAAQYNNIGAQHFANKEFAKALEYFQLAYQVSPDRGNPRSVQVLINLANTLIMLARYAEALEAADTILALEPTNSIGMMLRAKADAEIKMPLVRDLKAQGDIFVRTQQWSSALESFSLALECAPNDPGLKSMLLSMQSMVLNMLKKYGEALKRADEALRLQPLNAHAQNQFRLARAALTRIANGPVVG